MGEHILKKRLVDGLNRKVLACQFGVDETTVLNWEMGHVRSIPAPRIPAVIAYLGYSPEAKPDTVGAQLRWKRRSLGWTTREAARMNSVDPSTWSQWEKLERWPAYPRYRELVETFLREPAEQLVGKVRQVGLATPRRGRADDL